MSWGSSLIFLSKVLCDCVASIFPCELISPLFYLPMVRLCGQLGGFLVSSGESVGVLKCVFPCESVFATTLSLGFSISTAGACLVKAPAYGLKKK